jgi:hypothetical protein
MKPTLLDAINALIENAEVSVYGDENEDFEVLWLNGTKPVSNEKILEKLKELNADYDAKQYQRNRQPEYPAIGDQLDMLFHAIDAGKVDKTSDFYKSLKAVKDKHPKG